MQPIVNRQQAARITSALIEQAVQASLVASIVKSSEPNRKSQLPIVVKENIEIY